MLQEAIIKTIRQYLGESERMSVGPESWMWEGFWEGRGGRGGVGGEVLRQPDRPLNAGRQEGDSGRARGVDGGPGLREGRHY